MQIVVGMNLPMLLELYNAKNENDLNSCVNIAVKTGKKGIGDLETFISERG